MGWDAAVIDEGSLPKDEAGLPAPRVRRRGTSAPPA